MNFKCPYCNQPTTITAPNKFSYWRHFEIEKSKKGDVGLGMFVITCPNDECKNLYLKINILMLMICT